MRARSDSPRTSRPARPARPSSATTSRPHSTRRGATASTRASRSSSWACPGALLAALLTGGDRRRRRRSAATRPGAPARTRAPRPAVPTRLALAESLLVGSPAARSGSAAATSIGAAAFGSSRFGATTARAQPGPAISLLSAVAIATLAIALPAWRDARSITVARRAPPSERTGGPVVGRLRTRSACDRRRMLIYRATGGGVRSSCSSRRAARRCR